MGRWVGAIIIDCISVTSERRHLSLQSAMYFRKNVLYCTSVFLASTFYVVKQVYELR